MFLSVDSQCVYNIWASVCVLEREIFKFRHVTSIVAQPSSYISIYTYGIGPFLMGCWPKKKWELVRRNRYLFVFLLKHFPRASKVERKLRLEDPKRVGPHLQDSNHFVVIFNVFLTNTGTGWSCTNSWGSLNPLHSKHTKKNPVSDWLIFSHIYELSAISSYFHVFFFFSCLFF